MLEWSDPAHVPSLDTILTNVAIYWFTGTFPTSIWCYRPVSIYPHICVKRPAVDITCPQLLSGAAEATGEAITNGKPKGFSWFPHEIAALSKDFIRTDKHLTHIYENDEVCRIQLIFPKLRQAQVLTIVREVISPPSRYRICSGQISKTSCLRFGSSDVQRAGFRKGFYRKGTSNDHMSFASNEKRR